MVFKRFSTGGMPALKTSLPAFAVLLLLLVVYYVQSRFYHVFFYIYPSGSRLDTAELLGWSVFPEFAPYHSSSIVISSLSNPYVLLYGIAFVVLAILFRNKLAWEELGVQDKAYRFMICLIIGVLTWSYSFYGYNYFLDQAHLADRILLVAVNVIIFYRPLFLLIYVPLLMLIMSQFEYGIGGYSLTDKRMVINLLLMMNSWLVIHLIFAISRGGSLLKAILKSRYLLITALLVVVSASYLIPFISKITISRYWADWWLIEDFSVAAAAYFDRGWLAFLQPDSKGAILQWLPVVNAPLLFIAFIIEGLAIFLLAGRKTSLLLLVSFICLHIGIYSLSGIFFWKWILANFLLFLIIIRMEGFLPVEWKVAGFGAILLSPLFIHTTQLGWYSIPYQSVYYLQTETQAGNTYTVAGSDMAPYDIFFTFSRWDILDEKLIYGGDWASDPDKYQELLGLSIDELKEYDKMYGENRYSDESRERVHDLIKTYFKNYNNHPGYKKWFRYLSPPKHIYMSHPEHLFDFQERVTTVYIYHRRCYYETALISECRDKQVDSIEIK